MPLGVPSLDPGPLQRDYEHVRMHQTEEKTTNDMNDEAAEHKQALVLQSSAAQCFRN